MEPLLQVCNLNVTIRVPGAVLKPVRDVSLEVMAGETVAVVGESGCGKSLTALAIMGLLPKAATVGAARINLGGTSILGMSETRMRRIRGTKVAMIFQDPMTALDSCYRVGDLIVEVMRQHRDVSPAEALGEAYQLLERVGIPAPAERLRQYPHQLSGGLRQRVMIAMALSCNPSLLIADEPTTALDVTVQSQILRLLADIQQERGMGLLIITHDFGVVSAVADRVVVMYGGEVVEGGVTADVVGNPMHPYTEGLLRSLPIPGRTSRSNPLETIPGVVPLQVGELSHCGFASRCSRVVDPCLASPVPMQQLAGNRYCRCVRVQPKDVALGRVVNG